MAAALVVINDVDLNTNGELTLFCKVVFRRDDGSADMDAVQVPVGSADTVAQLGTKVGNAVRARATQVGLSIPTNQVLVPSLAKV